MNRHQSLSVTIVILCAIAAGISYHLVRQHLGGAGGVRLLDFGCSDNPESKFNCKAVLESPYSWLPPRFPDAPEGKGFVPAALVGLLYYGLLTIWFVGIGRPTPDRWYLHLLPILLIAGGLVGSAYFIWVMATKVSSWCPWCLFTHALNLAIAIMAVMLWPRRGQASAPTATESAPTVALPSHPTARALTLTLFSLWLTVVATDQWWGRENAAAQLGAARDALEQYKEAVVRIRGDSVKLLNNWRLADKQEIPIRPDDPIRSPKSADRPAMDVVVFSDFECPSCQRFAILMEQRFLGFFDGNLRIIYKHHPLDGACNPLYKGSMHPQACKAAAMAEAARMLGGNDAFWATHDFLYKNRDALERGDLDVGPLIESLKIDPDKFIATMQSADVQTRIREDIELSAKIGVKSTPAVFVSGRRVDPLATSEAGFWDQLAEQYWQECKTPRPQHTRPTRPAPKPAAQSATPGSPDQKAAP